VLFCLRIAFFGYGGLLVVLGGAALL